MVFLTRNTGMFAQKKFHSVRARMITTLEFAVIAAAPLPLLD